jgi:hypothetical protein
MEEKEWIGLYIVDLDGIALLSLFGTTFGLISRFDYQLCRRFVGQNQCCEQKNP